MSAEPSLKWVTAGCLLALAAMILPATARAQDQPCEVFAETFDSFVGPHNYADELIDVQWCLDGASVASGGFCVGGNALKLSSASHDATLRIAMLDDACAQVTLRFLYSQFAETGTVLRQGTTTSRSLCNASIPTVVGELNIIGGACIEVTHTVEIESGEVVLWRFDHGQPGNAAIYIDDVTIEVTGCCDAASEHECCEVGPAGCVDEAVMNCVCEIDPFCCENEWDAQCVALVEQLSCGSCEEGGNSDCMTDFETDFGGTFSSDAICDLLPDIFSECGGAGAPFLTNSGACSGSADAAIAFVEGFPHSYAQTDCIELIGLAEASLEFRYTKNTGTLGPSVLVALPDDTLQTVWTAPIFFDGGCVEANVDLSPYIEFGTIKVRIASGSSIANGARVDDLVLTTSDTSIHGCCEVGDPGCADIIVQDCVCAIDSFCCEEQWDELCVIAAEFYECGDCGLCSETFAADFDVPDPGGTPCERFPEKFAGCFGTGPFLSNATPCSDDPSDYAAVFVAGDELSAMVTRCISLKNVNQASVTFEYSKLDGQMGPILEASADVGGTWVPMWTAPHAPGAGSHRACVDLAPAVGINFLLFRFRGGEVGVSGQVIDEIAFQIGDSCVVAGDVTGDGSVGLADLLLVLSSWGLVCPPDDACPGDADDDGLVGLADLLMVLSNWGSTTG